MNKTKHFKRLWGTLLLLIAMLVPHEAWAIEYIKEIKVSVHKKNGETARNKLTNDGYKLVERDLNGGGGGYYIYIGYKTTTNVAEAITDLLIVESNGFDAHAIDNITNANVTYKGKKYYRCENYDEGDARLDCDLNRGRTGTPDIVLFYTKDGNTQEGGRPLTSLAVVDDTSSKGVVYTRHWKYDTPEDKTDPNEIAADTYGNTNSGCNSPHYIIYGHVHAYDMYGLCTCGNTHPIQGSGTEANPYLVTCYTDLVWLGNKARSNGNFHAKQTCNIDCGGRDIVPLGGSNGTFHYFTGTYDGGGFVISNARYVSHDERTDRRVGIFGAIKGATVKNLGVVGCHFEGRTSIGAVCGWIEPNGSNISTIENCFAVKNTLQSNETCAGICATVLASTLDRIKHCYTDVNIQNGRNITEGCYAVTGDFGTRITEENLKSGYLCYTLNQSSLRPWYQKLGTDDYPIMQKSGNNDNIVYKFDHLKCDGKTANGTVTYTNNSKFSAPVDLHQYANEFTVDDEATCIKKGSKSKHCTVCKTEKTQVTEVAMLNHIMSKHDAVAPTCIADGSLVYYTCSRTCCTGKLYKDNASHTTNEYGSAADLVDKKLGHNYGGPSWSWKADGSSATCSRTCTRTSCTDKTTGHTVSASASKIDSKVKVPAKCIEWGTTTYTATATVANSTYTNDFDVVNLEPLGHGTKEYEETYSWTGAAFNDASLDTKECTFTLQCKACGEDVVKGIVLDCTKTAHEDASCLGNGFTTYQVTGSYTAKNSKYNYSATKTHDYTITALDHDYANVVDGDYCASAANCGNDAVYFQKCSRCDVKGKKWTDEGTATGLHTFAANDPAQSVCTVCNHGFFRYTATAKVDPWVSAELKNAEGVSIYNADKHTFADDGKGVMEFDSPLAEIGGSAFMFRPALTAIDLQSISRVGTDAFAECPNLTSVTARCDLDLSNTGINESVVTRKHDYTLKSETETYLASAANCGNDATYYYKCVNCTEHSAEMWTKTGTSSGIHTFAADDLAKGKCTVCNHGFLRYTTSDHKVASLSNYAGSMDVKSNTYADGEGVMEFNTPLVTISDNAFRSRSTLTSLIIPSTVKTISYNAFIYCTGLTGNLIIPGSVDIIESNAFYSCVGLNGYVELSNPNVQIGSNAFDNCDNVTEFRIPCSVDASKAGIASERITRTHEMAEHPAAEVVDCGTPGNKLYYTCPRTNCQDIYYKNLAGTEAYTGKEEVFTTLPHVFAADDTEKTECPTCHHGFFRYTSKDNAVVAPSSPAELKAANNETLTIISNTNVNGEGVMEFNKPLAIIGESAFQSCRDLTGKPTIPSTVTRIGEGAFLYCTGFTGDLTIPNSVKNIDSEAFCYCTGLNGKLTLSNQLDSISGHAFYGCENLTGDLVIPNSVKWIGVSAFANCSGFNSVEIKSLPYVEWEFGWFEAFHNVTSNRVLTLSENSFIHRLDSDEDKYFPEVVSATAPCTLDLTNSVMENNPKMTITHNFPHDYEMELPEENSGYFHKVWYCGSCEEKKVDNEVDYCRMFGKYYDKNEKHSETISLTKVGDYYYTMLYTDFPYSNDLDAYVYEVDNVEGDKVKLTNLGSTMSHIESYRPVIIRSEYSSLCLEYDKYAVFSEPATGSLAQGTTEAITEPDEDMYAFSVSDTGYLGFWRWPGMTIPAWKGYLRLPYGANAKGMRLVFNEEDGTATSIELAPADASADGFSYDFAGRRVNKVHGLGIINGKKVYIKKK